MEKDTNVDRIIKFYSHRIKENGYMSNFYGEQDKNFNLNLPINQDFNEIDLSCFDPDDSEFEIFNYSTSEHPYQIQKYFPTADFIKKISLELLIKYQEYRDIMSWLKNPRDLAAMGRQSGATSIHPKLVPYAPKWIKEKCLSTTLINIIKEYKDFGVKMREDWDQVKDKVMHVIVLQKFLQNPHLSKNLKNTGESKLIEHTKNDKYWADGGDGKGLNKLGQILMQVRDELVI